MSVAEGLNTEMQAVATGLSAAEQAASGADVAVEGIARNAAMNGFSAIAESLMRVRHLIARTRSQLGNAAEAAADTRATITAVSAQGSPEQTVAVLTPLLAGLSSVEARIAGAAEATGQAKHATRTALQGGQPEELLARLDRILQILAAVRIRASTARQQVHDAITMAQQSGAFAGNRHRVAADVRADHPGRSNRDTALPVDRRPHVRLDRAAPRSRRFSRTSGVTPR